MPTPIKLFQSSDTGAPVMSGQAGALIGVLDACLLNGYNPVSVSSITRSGGTATVTTSGAHGFNSAYKDSVTIAGANEADYNGDFYIAYVDATHFTYTVGGTPASPATGAITAKRGAANGSWAKAHSGTNLAAYRSGNGIRHYLRVDDTAAQVGRIRGYEAMTGISTGTGVYPTDAQVSGGLYQLKSNAASGASRPWFLIADDRFFYLGTAHNTTYSTLYDIIVFGEFPSFKTGDSYNSMVFGQTQDNKANPPNHTATFVSASAAATQAGHYLARAYTGGGTSVNFGKVGPVYGMANMGGSAAATYPNAADSGLLFAYPTIVNDGVTTVYRGILPGVYAPLHNAPGSHGDVVRDPIGFAASGDLFLAKLSNSTTPCSVLFDVTRAWR